MTTPRIDALDKVNVETLAANKTLIYTDYNIQVLTATALYNTVTLPSTGIVKGKVFEIHNRSTAYDLIIKASDATTRETIQAGRVQLVALQDTPTTYTHWHVRDVYEEITTTVRFRESGGSNVYDRTMRFYRKNKVITMCELYWEVTMSAAGYILVSPASSGLPQRLWAANSNIFLIGTRDGSGDAVGIMAIDSSGNWNIYKDITAGNFTSGLLSRPVRGSIINGVTWVIA